MGLRLVMMGTGEFALPTFLRLYESPHKIIALVTQPDRTGRGHHQHLNPLKQAAQERGTPVFQPVSANAPESLLQLRTFAADLFLVAAYGQILSAELLAIPRLGAVNIHASLLPKFRGAAPVACAILAGEEKTGVTIFQIEPRLDAGPMLGMVSTAIGPKETAGELEQRLSTLAIDLTQEVLAKIEHGTATPLPQDSHLASHAPRLSKAQGAINWSQSAVDIERHVRAMQPWPSPFTHLHRPAELSQRVLLLDVDPEQGNAQGSLPGAIIAADPDVGIRAQAGTGTIRINCIQPAGKRPMSAIAFLRGHSIPEGSCFGP